MAIRYRQDRRKWQVYWHNPFTGRQESAFCETKEEAQKNEALVKYRLRWERDSFRRPETPDEAPDNSLGAVDFAYMKSRRWPKKRLVWHHGCMREALAILGRKPVAEITTRDIAEVLTKALDMADGRGIGRLVSRATATAHVHRLITVLRWAYDQGYIDALPRIPKIPGPQYKSFIPPTPEELDRLLAAAAPHVQRVIILGAKLGMRVGPSEMFKLTWDDVDLAAGVVRVPAAKKNPREPWRDVPIMDALLPVFRAWKDADDREGVRHLVHFRGKPVGGIKCAWDATLRRAGISRRIRPYDLRHAFATDALAAGQDVGTVSRLMGHATPAMTLNVYQHVRAEQKKEAVNALPDVHGLGQKGAQPIMPNAEHHFLQ